MRAFTFLMKYSSCPTEVCSPRKPSEKMIYSVVLKVSWAAGSGSLLKSQQTQAIDGRATPCLRFLMLGTTENDIFSSREEETFEGQPVLSPQSFYAPTDILRLFCLDRVFVK